MVQDKTVVSMIHKLGDQVEYLGPDDFTKVWRAEFAEHKKLGESLKKKAGK
jgi:hypothetical protein